MTVLGRSGVFVPGHITGFFEVMDGARNPLMKGSRGAGICTSLGVLTDVAVEDGSGLKIYLDGKLSDAPVTRKAINNIMYIMPGIFSKARYRITVRSKLQLPVSQGFGMSGAGALGVALGVARALKLRIAYRNIVAAAHMAEVECRTGLGDVAAQSVGGVEMRVRPGAPPFGKVQNIPVKEGTELVLATIGGKMRTKDVLSDSRLRERITIVGRKCMESFARQPTLENLFEYSNRFSVSTGLSTEEVISAIREIRDSCAGMAAQSMLGNSVFAVGKTKRIVRILEGYGNVWKCGIAPGGPELKR